MCSYSGHPTSVATETFEHGLFYLGYLFTLHHWVNHITVHGTFKASSQALTPFATLCPGPLVACAALTDRRLWNPQDLVRQE